MELFRRDEQRDFEPQMVYISETKPGEERGPHEHTEQTDYFAFCGPGSLLVRLWDTRPSSTSFGTTMSIIAGESRPTVVVVPPGVVHGYRNISACAAWVFNSPDRLYRGHGKLSAIDEIRHEDDPASPFRMDP